MKGVKDSLGEGFAAVKPKGPPPTYDVRSGGGGGEGRPPPRRRSA